MYANDPDEDVEEEEEFHEVEEEKHKTSQESVGSSSGQCVNAPPQHALDNDQQKQQPEAKPQNKGCQPEEEICNETKLDDKSPAEESGTKSSGESPAISNEFTQSVVAAGPSSTTVSAVLSTPQPPSPLAPTTTTTTTTTTDKPLNDKSERPYTAQVNNEQVLVEHNVASNEAIGQDTLDGPPPSESTEKTSKDIDWANIMLRTQTPDSNHSTPDEVAPNGKSELESESQDSERKSTDSSIMNNIIKDTQDKLKIVDESTSQSIERKVESNHQDLPQEETTESKTTALEDGHVPQQASNEEEQSEKSKQQVTKAKDGEEDTGTTEDQPDGAEKKELDLDEDVKNPQYIPKKGVFYEHDDRSHDVDEKKPSTATNNEEDTPENKEATSSKKTATQDRQPENRRSNRRQRTDADRWNHDLFRGEKQKPKSKSELINAYGYDIRQERGGRNQQTDNRHSRANNNTNSERPQGSLDSQRSRQSKDVKVQRQNQPANRSRERRARRQNVTNKNTHHKNDGTQGSEVRRDTTMANRTSRSDVKDPKDTTGDEKHVKPPASASLQAPNIRREQEVSSNNRNSRTDSRGRRKTSRDRPTTTNEAVLPPANTVMPPITTWSNEDMMKAEAFGKKSPPRIQNQSAPTAASSNNNNTQRDRSTDFWQQNQQNKVIYQDRPLRNQDEPRQQQNYNPRGRYQERGDENYRTGHNVPRNNHYNDRSNQNPDWHRAGNFSPYSSKSNDYIVKTQTFENSRLSQTNMNRSSNNRDLREVLNERRMQGQSNYRNKVQHGLEHHTGQRGPNQFYGHQHQYGPPHAMHQQQQQHMGVSQQQAPQMAHMMQTQQSMLPHHQQQQPQQQTQRHQQQQQQQLPPSSAQQQATNQTQAQNNTQVLQTQQIQNHRQRSSSSTPAQSNQGQARQNVGMTSAAADGNGQDSSRSGSLNNADAMNSRPIIKTDSYTGTGLHQHQPPLSQHSQNHRSVSGGGPMGPQGPTASHMVPSHLGAGASQAQYFTPSPGSRDPAYHGYITGGHPVMDATRYHMQSQQMADHGYMTTSGQASDVAGGPVLHQQGMYPDASAGGAVANSAYLAQPGSTISPTTNIPVTGTGPQPMAPYIQHSQYPPPPYTNPYTQPQSGHAYPPYWTYI